MKLAVKLLLSILGLGAIIAFIETLEFADQLYQVSRVLPQPFADISSVAVIGIILMAIRTLDREK